MLARALQRLGRFEAALDVCAAIDDRLSDLEQGELLILKAQAYLRLGQLDEIEELLLGARVAAYSSCSAALEADYEFFEATVRFYSRDLDAASAALERAMTAAPPAQLWLKRQQEYFLSLGLVRARAFDLRGLLARAKEGLLAQLEWARLALSELDAQPLEDHWVSATLLSNFASFAVQVGEPSLADELRQRSAHMSWVDSTKLCHFNVVRAVGWLCALGGDHVGAFREFRRSAELAPSTAWRIESILDRAFLARELGQEMFADDELNYAIELAKDVDLSPAKGSSVEFTALVKLAELTAKRDPNEGRAILNRFRTARSKCPAILFDGMDRGWQAKELVAEATVARAEGRQQLAIDLFVNAFDAYDKLGSRWRAALVALDLAEMTEQPFFYGYAAREANCRPNSWLGRRLATLSSKQPELALG
ncbi:MAG: hypothetical protein ACLPSH_01315 [Vulcanimicrobiaceae bacterium]